MCLTLCRIEDGNSKGRDPLFLPEPVHQKSRDEDAMQGMVWSRKEKKAGWTEQMPWFCPHALFKIKAATIPSVMGEILLTAVSFISKNCPQLKRVTHSRVDPLEVRGVNGVCMYVKSLPLGLTLCNPIDGSPLGSSVHQILWARMLEWVAIFSSRGSSRPGDGTHISYISCIGRWVLYHQHQLGTSQWWDINSQTPPSSQGSSEGPSSSKPASKTSGGLCCKCITSNPPPLPNHTLFTLLWFLSKQLSPVDFLDAHLLRVPDQRQWTGKVQLRCRQEVCADVRQTGVTQIWSSSCSWGYRLVSHQQMGNGEA